MSCHVMSVMPYHIISYQIVLYYVIFQLNDWHLLTDQVCVAVCVTVWRDYTLYTVCNFTSFVLTVFMASSA